MAQLVARLMSLGIEVQRATAPLALQEGTCPAGTYVVRLDQPYRNYAVDLLSAQQYPRDAPEAYDDVSWAFPAHYHLTVIPTADPQVRAARLAPLTDAPHARGTLSGSGPVYLLRDTGQEGLLEARYRARAVPRGDRRACLQRRWRRLSGGLLDSRPAERSRAGTARCGGAARAGFRQHGRGAGCCEARGACATPRRVGAVGGYGHHRLGALRARPAPRSLCLRAR